MIGERSGPYRVSDSIFDPFGTVTVSLNGDVPAVHHQ